MKRIYAELIKEHFQLNQQMLFIVGPRQAGKTTVSLMSKSLSKKLTYLNWDNLDHRTIILQGPEAVAKYACLNKLLENTPLIIFDEIHKYNKWKTFLKGFFDTYKENIHIIVTGSSKLDTYRKSGDSLMGRYFSYRLHPLSLSELNYTTLSETEISPPHTISPQNFKNLLTYGGFPEPFLKKNKRFLNQWSSLREKQLFKEDLRELSRVQELGQMEILAQMLKHQPGQLTNYSTLASKINISVDTVRRWIRILESFFYCFAIRPWSKNIPRSLLKEPKIYLWDWSFISDEGSRLENFIALHLLKSIHFWQDRGMGNYGLYFLRDKEKREVDFIITKEQEPWFLVEVKKSHNTSLSKSLFYFQKKIQAPHAFQVVFDMKPINKNCFKHTTPIIVPAQTFLSQLI